MTPIQIAAREAVKAGLSVIPPAEDGTKRPAPIWPARDGNAGSWAPYMKACAEKTQLAAWWGPRLGIGVACGKVSGNLECFEFDDRATYDEFKSLAHDSEMDGLLSTLEAGYTEDSPSGGVHWLYRCETIAGNAKLANRPDGQNKVKTLIEVRGEGGYVIVAPSGGPVHPSGQPYVLRGGGFATIPTLTPDERDDLYQLARALDEMPTQEYQPSRPEPVLLSESRPGDDYSARATWGSILEPVGWKWLYRRGDEDYWRRPGKTTGMSASTNYGGFGFLKVFSSSTEFETNRSYSKFSAYALLNHRGDYALAAKVLAAKGYGAALSIVPKKKKAAPKTPVDAAVAEHELQVAQTNTALLADRQFGAGGEGRYLFIVPGAGIAFDLDRVRRERNELIGELAVRCDLPGSQTVGNDASLVVADFNLSSLQARQTRAKLLAERSKAYDLDWYGLLEDFCQRVILAERQGNPAISLRQLQRPEASRAYDLHGWRVPSDHPTILFGDGGALKSYFALYACGVFAQQGVRVMFVDWELDGAEHRDRLERLFGAEMPDILYIRAERPLVSEADRLKRIRTDERVDYAIYDSIAFACAGPPESAEIAAEYFRAVRKIGGGSLHIAHVNRSETSDQKPFGCYSADTEVLTLGGWKPHADVTLADEVLAFDPNRHVYEWQRPTHLHQHTYNGEMVHISGVSVDMLVTPNHRMVVKKPRSGGTFTGEWRFVEAGAFTGSTMRIPASAELDDAFSLDPSDAFIRFLGWWVAEGSLNEFGPVLTQVPGQLADRMKRAVLQLGYTAKVWVGKTPGRDNEQPCMQMRLRKATRLGRWLAREAGEGAHHKRLPRAVFGWSHQARELLLSSLMEGDGHWNSTSRGTYTTVSRQLADDVQQLALMTGWTARVRDERIRCCVLIGRRKALDIRVSRHVSRKPYGGKVFCLTLPAGAYVTRRNGHAGIAGNSAFWHNGARSTWFTQQGETSPGQPTRVALINRKANLGPLQPALAFSFCFDNGQTSISRSDVTDITEVSSKLPLWQKMRGALSKGPMTCAQLADETGEKLDSISREIRRHEDRYYRSDGIDGTQRIHLIDRHSR